VDHPKTALLSKRVGVARPPRDTQTYVGLCRQPNLRGATIYSSFRLTKPVAGVEYPGVLLRLSSRWYRHWESKTLPLPIPYIDHVGKFTIHQLGSLWMTPEQWFASITATVSDRLYRLYCRRNKHSYVKRHVRLLVTRAAVLYTATHNNYIMDRLLANLRPERLKVFERLLHYFVCSLGTNFRFVYSQTCSQVSWLSFRSKWIRDKPNETTKMLLDHCLTFKVGKMKKHRFTIGNPFLCTLNYLKVWKDGNFRV
jgi:hypothetical protein